MPTQKPRYSLTIDEEIWAEVDDFRYENRYPTRSAAIQRLIEMGLEQARREKDAKASIQKSE